MDDSKELIEVLIKVFKLETQVYEMTTDIFEEKKLSERYKSMPIFQIQSLLKSGEDDAKLCTLLDELMESDVTIYLKILTEIDTGND